VTWLVVTIGPVTIGLADAYPTRGTRQIRTPDLNCRLKRQIQTLGLKGGTSEPALPLDVCVRVSPQC
jgi:hypothetical protein